MSEPYWNARARRRTLAPPLEPDATPDTRRGKLLIVAKLVGGLAIATIATCVFLLLAGYVIVIDRRGEIASVSVANAHYEQSLHKIPGGVFVLVPKIEGRVRAVCRSGTIADLGYFADHQHVSAVTADATCVF